MMAGVFVIVISSFLLTEEELQIFKEDFIMKRERLMSGQRWYFEEDGTSVTLDLVVDIWFGVKETSHVMIGGLWYDEETIQKMISGRRNNFYRYDGDEKTWCHAYVSSDIKVITAWLEREMDKMSSWELDDDVVLKIADDFMADMTADGGAELLEDGGFLVGGVVYYPRTIALALRDTKRNVKVW